MRLDSKYTLTGIDDIASAIDHYLLRKLPEHARTAVLDLCRGTEILLREKLSLIRAHESVDRVRWHALLDSLDEHGVELPMDALGALRDMRNDAKYRGAYPDRVQLEDAAKPVFRFVWRFIHDELGFAPGEAFDDYHAAILQGEPLTLTLKAMLFSVAAMRHVHEEPQYGVEFADEAVDCIVRDLAQGCGMDQEGMSFADVVARLLEMRDDCAPWYAIPLGDGDYSDLRYVTRGFIDHAPGRMDTEAAESYVSEARYVVKDIAEHLHRRRWEQLISQRWRDVLDVLARESPESRPFVPGSVSQSSSLSVYGDIIAVRSVGGARAGDQALAADIQGAIREVLPQLPPGFRVEVRGLGYAIGIHSYDDDDVLDDSSDT